MTNLELIEHARKLVKVWRCAGAELLATIEMIDLQEAWKEDGYTSTFDFCVRDLRLSEDDAAKNIYAARAARRRPEILSYLEQGTMTIRVAALLAPLRKSPDFPVLVERCQNKTVREVEDIIASYAANGVRTKTVTFLARELEDSTPIVMTIVADASLQSLIRRTQDLLRHKYPSGRLEEVLGDVLAAFLLRRDPIVRRKIRARKIANAHRRVASKALKDAVWKRDGGRCVFVDEAGKRCDATGFLELDHKTAWSKGGPTDAANLQLLCRAHNQWKGAA